MSKDTITELDKLRDKYTSRNKYVMKILDEHIQQHNAITVAASGAVGDKKE